MHVFSPSRPALPCCIWLTGLSGAGKTTLANLLADLMRNEGRQVAVLDGDCLREGLNAGLGFSRADRAESVRRAAEAARLLAEAGVTVIVALISPFELERRKARARFAPGAFIEVFVDTPLEICETRDAKGLYARARQGLLSDFTGIDHPYEAPSTPELHVTGQGSATETAASAYRQLRDRLAQGECR